MSEGTTKRVAYSPGEFAELFGKSQTWGYRQIYAGKVKAITEHGRILIPAKEVERILESAGIYNGRPTPKQTKTQPEKLSPEQQSIWRRFVAMRQQTPGQNQTSPKALRQGLPVEGAVEARKAVLGRISAAWQRKPREG